MTSAGLRVLLVEDDPGDAHLTRHVLSRRGIHHVEVVRDGQSALDYLRGQGRFQQRAVRPHLVILDLNLPGVDGRQVLESVKTDPDLAEIPVAVVSTSSDIGDITSAYRAYANSYSVKPMELDDYVELIEGLGAFWTETARLHG